MYERDWLPEWQSAVKWPRHRWLPHASNAALGFMQLDRWNEPKPPGMTVLARWMDSWTGIGAIVTGMAAQGCDLQLTEYAGENWRATFFVIGMAHSIVKGSAYGPTPWQGVQRAAWEAVAGSA